MGNLFTEEVGKVLTRLLGNYLTEILGKVLDIYKRFVTHVIEVLIPIETASVGSVTTPRFAQFERTFYLINFHLTTKLTCRHEAQRNTGQVEHIVSPTVSAQ